MPSLDSRSNRVSWDLLANSQTSVLRLLSRISRSLIVALVALSSYSGRAHAFPDTRIAGVAPALSDSMEWATHALPNGEDETYLRYLQLVGAIPRYPWSLRGFSGDEAQRLAARVGSHPWSRSPSFTSIRRRAGLLPLSAELRGNSAFPYGSNDGPVWAGRGLTASVSAGFAVATGPISLVLAPVAFIAQNVAFDLADNGQTENTRFGDGQFLSGVDRPQRFGDKPYGRIDAGNSTLRVDIGPFTTGLSTANMAWGPLELYPYVPGTNAPGFLHGFAGTSRPVNILLGSLHGRVIWGRLEQSDYSTVDGEPTYVSPVSPGTRRFASGLSLIFEPRGAPGLELGVARFFHSPWPRSGIPPSYFTKPFENVLKNRLRGAPGFSDPGTSADNQLISGFARWVFPSAGFEMYGEYGREDHSWDKRDFVQEPDHSRSYGLGFRKTLLLTPERVDGLTIELINFQLPHLARTGRGEGSVYIHGVMRQGHTNRGQLLGADVGVGAAAGSTIRWDRYRPRGHTAFSLRRTVRQERGAFFIDGTENPKSTDTQYALDGVLMRRFQRVELTTVTSSPMRSHSGCEPLE